jgi:demethoxyubiquinone hydroxylase (CLK1/Coq7/Cat5 family)
MSKLSQISTFLIRNQHDPLFREILAGLKSNHAGEYGAVRIYDGILYANSLKTQSNADLAEFAHRHRQAESHHLQTMSELLPLKYHTKLIPLWHVSGCLLGALPTLIAGSKVKKKESIQRAVHFMTPNN